MDGNKSFLEILWDVMSPRQRKMMMGASERLAKTVTAMAVAAEDVNKSAKRLLNALEEQESTDD